MFDQAYLANCLRSHRSKSFRSNQTCRVRAMDVTAVVAIVNVLRMVLLMQGVFHCIDESSRYLNHWQGGVVLHTFKRIDLQHTQP